MDHTVTAEAGTQAPAAVGQLSSNAHGPYPGEMDLPPAHLLESVPAHEGISTPTPALLDTTSIIAEGPSMFHDAALGSLQTARNAQTRTLYDTACAGFLAAVRHTYPDDPQRVSRLHLAGECFHEIWQLSGDANHCNISLHFLRKAVALVETRETDVLSAYLSDLAAVLVRRYDSEGALQDQTEALAVLQRAVEVSADLPQHAIMLSRLADFMRAIGITAGAQRTIFLGRALTFHETAIAAAAASGSPQLGQVYRNAAVAYAAMFDITTQLKLSARALQCWSIAIESVRSDETSCTEWEIEQTNHLINRYVVSMDLDDIRNALTNMDAVLEDDPTSSIARACKALCYAKLLIGCSNSKVGLQRATEAATLIDQALSDQDVSSLVRAKWYHWSSGIRHQAFEYSLSIVDLEVAVGHALEATSFADHPDRWNHERNAAELLNLLFEQTSNPDCLGRAVNHARQALELVPQWEDQNFGLCYWTYGKVLSRTFATDSNPSILDDSISMLQAACIIQDPNDKALVLNDLGNTYATKFKQNHELATAEASANAYMEALSLLGQSSGQAIQIDTQMLHAGLGYLMLCRFTFWGSIEDLNMAIKHYQYSLEDVDTIQARHITRVCNLAHAFQLRFTYDRNTRHLVASQKILNRVLGQTAPPLEYKPKVLALMHQGIGQHHMSVALEQPSRRRNAADAAIATFEQIQVLSMSAKDLVTARHASVNLAASCASRARSSNLVDDIHSTLKAYEAATLVIDPEHTDNWTLQDNLGNFLQWANSVEPGQAYAERAIPILEATTQTLVLPPSNRIMSLSALAHVYVDERNDYTRAARYLEQAADLLPEAILSHSNRLEQLHFVRKFAFIPSSAAALFVASGRSVTDCISILERTRGFLYHRQIAGQTEVEELQNKHLEEYKAFEAARQEVIECERTGNLAIAAPTSQNLTMADVRRLKMQKSSKELNDMIANIRTLDGFAHFLRTTRPLVKRSAELADLDIPIVWVNLSRYSCDAFVLFKARAESIHLDSVVMDEVESNAAKLILAQEALRRHELAGAAAAYEEVMRWLWQCIAKPVMHALTERRLLVNGAGRDLPRLYWVSSGWLSILPIHAAGDFGSGTGESVHRLAISSYVATLEALTNMRTRLPHVQQHLDESAGDALLVGMNNTASRPKLTARAELDAVANRITTEQVHNVQDDAATFETVAKLLQECDIAHFACHAHADERDPSLSALVLADYLTKPLHVRSIIRLHIKNCGSCFLSACDSGSSKDLLLRDENVHIAGALQMAGVLSVVASAWSVADNVCRTLADTFYARAVIKTSPERDARFTIAEAPYALHAAIQELQDKDNIPPILWGAWFHVGV